ncbi:hypothetical protein A2U01_0103894, partial [Trifolium medium]|nr:hypothetical protein [Trifolium medium]
MAENFQVPGEHWRASSLSEPSKTKSLAKRENPSLSDTSPENE